MRRTECPEEVEPANSIVVVAASSLYTLWRETGRRRRPAVPAPQRGSPTPGCEGFSDTRRTGS